MSLLRESLFRCLDDCRDLTNYLEEAKKAIVADGDARRELQMAETKLDKVIENFHVIIKEIEKEYAKKDTETNGTLP